MNARAQDHQLYCCTAGLETIPIGIPRLRDAADVLAPDLRGFGQSDKYEANPEEIYSAHRQARAIAALMDEVGLKNAVVAGYDMGGAVSQMLAAKRPDLVKALVVSPHLPGAGKRVLEFGPVREFWYTSFHQLDLARQLIDGNRDAVRAYLRHFWSHWSGPSYIVDDDRIDHLVGSVLGAGRIRSFDQLVSHFIEQSCHGLCDRDQTVACRTPRDTNDGSLGGSGPDLSV